MMNVVDAIAAAGCLETLFAVSRAPRFVGEIAAELALDVPGVSRCLGTLVHAGLLCYTCIGTFRRYEVSPNVEVRGTPSAPAVVLHAADGSRVTLEPSAATMRALGVPAPMLSVIVPPAPPKPAAAPSPPGGARAAPRPPTAPG